MRNFLLLPLLLTVAPLVSAAADQPVRHRFVCVDNGKNQLILVDQIQPARSWCVPIPAGSRDIQFLPAEKAEKILVSHGNGAAEYDLATGRKLPWCVDRYSAIQSAVRLASGQTLLCSVDGTVYRLDADGREIARAKASVKMNVRLMRPLKNGNLLLSGAAPGALLEIDARGQVVRQIPLPPKAKGYKAIELASGNFLTGTGDLCTIAQVNTEGKIVSSVGGKTEHPALGLDFTSGWDVLKNGNTIMANWLGHAKQGKGVHLAEFTPENKLVWQWADHELAKYITNVMVLE